jgi:hypothetical protein
MNQQQAPYAVDGLIYSPDQAVTAATNYIQSARDNIAKGLGLQFPIPQIATEYPVPPVLPGKILTVQAQSHNGKSMFLDFWKSDLAKRLMLAQKNDDIIISILAEDMVEEQMAVQLMREAERRGERASIDKMDGILMVAGHLGSVPIYYIGASIERAGDKLPVANMTNVEKAIFRIIEKRADKGQKTVVQGVFLDYIQAMLLDPALVAAMPDKKRNLQVKADFFALREVAARIPAPIVCASQSKQKLENAPGMNMLTPGLYDHFETSTVPQHTDSDFSLWMPKTTHAYNEVITHGKDKPIEFRVVDELAWLSCNKQRGFDPVTLQRLPANKKWPLKIDFATGEYSLWSTQGSLDSVIKTMAQRKELA